jgi:WD40 repeat protein
VELSDGATGERLEPLLAADHGAVVQLVGDPAGSTLATATADGTVTVWDVEATEPIVEIATDRGIDDLAYSPRAGVLATLTDDFKATLWDVSTGDELHTVEGVYNALALSPDGAFLVGPWDPTFDGDGEVRIWSTDTWEVVHEIIAPPFSLDIAFSGDGALLSVVGVEGVVRLVDTDDWNVRRFTGNLGRTWGVTIDQRGTTIATASDAGLHVWDTSAARLALILTDVPFPEAPGIDMSFSPDGTRLAAPTVDGAATVYLFNVDELMDLARGDLTRGFTDQECRRYLHLARCPPV